MKIDAHQHFWTFDAVKHSWIDGSMSALQRNFHPDDLKGILDKHHIDGCVSVQVDQCEAETDYLLAEALTFPFIKGVVGWVDLQADAVEDRLAYYSQFATLKGFRHILQAEPDRALMLSPTFMRGIRALKQFDHTFDVLIYPDQLAYTQQFLKSFPSQRFVIDHIAKPAIKGGSIRDWKKDIETLAKNENVCCKVSGMVTEADWNNWTLNDFEPYLEVVFNAFGTDRLMFGSDWPVCNLAGGYDKVVSIVQNYTSKLSGSEQELFWGGNAVKFYKL